MRLSPVRVATFARHCDGFGHEASMPQHKTPFHASQTETETLAPLAVWCLLNSYRTQSQFCQSIFVNGKAIHERILALRIQMAEILKADLAYEHSRLHHAIKKTAHEARLATLEHIKQELASFSSSRKSL